MKRVLVILIFLLLNQYLYGSNYLKELKIINLEASDSTLIDAPFKFIIYNNKLYILSYYANIFAGIYTINGKLKKIFVKEGQGPKRISNPIDITIVNNKIIIADGMTLHLKCFDLNGKYLGYYDVTDFGYKLIEGTSINKIILYHGQPSFGYNPITIFDLYNKNKLKVGTYKPINKVQSKFFIKGVCTDKNKYFYVVFAKENIIYKFNFNGDLIKKIEIPKKEFNINNKNELLKIKYNSDFTKIFFNSPRITGIFYLKKYIIVQIEENIFKRGFRFKNKLLFFDEDGKYKFKISDIPKKIRYSDGNFLYAIKNIDKKDIEKIINPSIIKYKVIVGG